MTFMILKGYQNFQFGLLSGFSIWISMDLHHKILKDFMDLQDFKRFYDFYGLIEEGIRKR